MGGAVSKGETTLTYQITSEKLDEPEREHRFDPARRWRFDFAWPDRLLAVEVEGGIWSKGRHSRGAGFEADAEKYNAAVMLGWCVLRYSTGMVERGDAIRDLKELLK